MGAPDWTALVAELNRYRELVSRHFRLVVFGNTERDSGAVKIDLGRFWDTQAETAALAESLARAGFAASDEATRLLLELRSSALVRKLDEPGRKRLQALLPPLLADVAGRRLTAARSRVPCCRDATSSVATSAPSHRSHRPTLDLFRATARERRRSRAAGRTVWARRLPDSADCLPSDRFSMSSLTSVCRSCPSRASLEDEARSRLEQVNDDDPEHQVEALRHFQRVAIFRVAVARSHRADARDAGE